MLVCAIQGNFTAAKKEILLANEQAECIEFRLDLMEACSLEKIAALKNLCKLPVIFTCREKSHFSFLSLKPDFVDIAWDAPYFETIPPEIKVIASHHDFEKTPEDLRGLLTQMRRKKAHFYKIATFALSSIDALRMLDLTQKETDVAGMCMGELGAMTRILGPIVNSPLTYTVLQNETAPGQLLIDALIRIYHFKKLNPSTKIYALIGDPIKHSIGYLFHNQMFQKKNVNAVYVNLLIRKEEVSSFFTWIKDLPFMGVSVTMPLKEKVAPYLTSIDEEAEKIGAINTLINKEGEWHGTNTDGKGALNALEKRGAVAGQVVLILGAGGAAKAIAQEAFLRGGKVVIANRTLEKGKHLAALVSGEAISLDAIGLCSYSFLINTTPLGRDASPVPNKDIRKGIIALDALVSKEKTPLLEWVEELGGEAIQGREMFTEQALLQQEAWAICP